jgi:hypothetical protein
LDNIKKLYTNMDECPQIEWMEKKEIATNHEPMLRS